MPLPQLERIDKAIFPKLRDIYNNFSVENAQEVKDIESVTNHDVKAVEYFIKRRFDELGLQQYKEFVHFGLTSQDINNTSLPMMIQDSVNEVYLPLLQKLITLLNEDAA